MVKIYPCLVLVFPYIVLIVLTHVSLIPDLFKVFVMKGCCILPNAFSAYIGIIMWFLFFSLLMYYITFIDFAYVCHVQIALDPGQ